MVDIQSAAAEIRRGKKIETTGQKYNVRILLCRAAIKKKKEETTGQKYNGLPFSIGRP